jgi:hypothetical protein
MRTALVLYQCRWTFPFSTFFGYWLKKEALPVLWKIGAQFRKPHPDAGLAL